MGTVIFLECTPVVEYSLLSFLHEKKSEIYIYMNREESCQNFPKEKCQYLSWKIIG